MNTTATQKQETYADTQHRVRHDIDGNNNALIIQRQRQRIADLEAEIRALTEETSAVEKNEKEQRMTKKSAYGSFATVRAAEQQNRHTPNENILWIAPKADRFVRGSKENIIFGQDNLLSDPKVLFGGKKGGQSPGEFPGTIVVSAQQVTRNFLSAWRKAADAGTIDSNNAAAGGTSSPLTLIRRGTSIDSIDVKAAKEFDVRVINTPGINSPHVAQFVIASLNVAEYIDKTKNDPSLPPPKVVVFGAGSVGKHVISYMQQTFGIKSHVITRTSLKRKSDESESATSTTTDAALCTGYGVDPSSVEFHTTITEALQGATHIAICCPVPGGQPLIDETSISSGLLSTVPDRPIRICCIARPEALSLEAILALPETTHLAFDYGPSVLKPMQEKIKSSSTAPRASIAWTSKAMSSEACKQDMDAAVLRTIRLEDLLRQHNIKPIVRNIPADEIDVPFQYHHHHRHRDNHGQDGSLGQGNADTDYGIRKKRDGGNNDGDGLRGDVGLGDDGDGLKPLSYYLGPDYSYSPAEAPTLRFVYGPIGEEHPDGGDADASPPDYSDPDPAAVYHEDEDMSEAVVTPEDFGDVYRALRRFHDHDSRENLGNGGVSSSYDDGDLGDDSDPLDPTTIGRGRGQGTDRRFGIDDHADDDDNPDIKHGDHHTTNRRRRYSKNKDGRKGTGERDDADVRDTYFPFFVRINSNDGEKRNIINTAGSISSTNTATVQRIVARQDVITSPFHVPNPSSSGFRSAGTVLDLMSMAALFSMITTIASMFIYSEYAKKKKRKESETRR